MLIFLAQELIWFILASADDRIRLHDDFCLLLRGLGAAEMRDVTKIWT